MHCIFESTVAGRQQCVRCGRQVAIARPGLRLVRACTGARGLGDRIAVAAHVTGVGRLVKGIAHKLGVDCGCDDRRDSLNSLLPSH